MWTVVYTCNHFLFLSVRNERHDKEVTNSFLVSMYLALAVHFDVSKGQPFHDRQCLLSLQVSSHSSQATKDSGLGLKYTASTPLRKPQPGQQEEKDSSGPLPASGYWVYSPIRSTLHKSFSKRGRPHCIRKASLFLPS